MQLLEWCLIALLTALTCSNDWHARVEREHFEGCFVLEVEVWRYQKPWTGFSLEYPPCP